MSPRPVGGEGFEPRPRSPLPLPSDGSAQLAQVAQVGRNPESFRRRRREARQAAFDLSTGGAVFSMRIVAGERCSQNLPSCHGVGWVDRLPEPRAPFHQSLEIPHKPGEGLEKYSLGQSAYLAALVMRKLAQHTEAVSRNDSCCAHAPFRLSSRQRLAAQTSASRSRANWAGQTTCRILLA